MSQQIQRSNAGKSAVQARVEHVFTCQKSQTELFIRIVGITHADTRTGSANLAYDMHCVLFLERIGAIMRQSRTPCVPLCCRYRANIVAKNFQHPAVQIQIKTYRFRRQFFDPSSLIFPSLSKNDHRVWSVACLVFQKKTVRRLSDRWRAKPPRKWRDGAPPASCLFLHCSIGHDFRIHIPDRVYAVRHSA